MALPGNEHLSTGPKLAAAAKVDRKTINNILRKRHSPKLEILDQIAKALKVEPYLLVMPIEQKDFAQVSKAYSVTDERGREFLLDTATTLIKKSERAKDSEAFRA